MILCVKKEGGGIVKNQKQLIDQIRSTRKSQGFTQLDIAKKVGLSRAQIANLEGGRHNCSLPRFLQICEILGIEWADFDNADNIKRNAEIKAMRDYRADFKRFHTKITKFCLEASWVYDDPNDS